MEQLKPSPENPASSPPKPEAPMAADVVATGKTELELESEKLRRERKTLAGAKMKLKTEVACLQNEAGRLKAVGSQLAKPIVAKEKLFRLEFGGIEAVASQLQSMPEASAVAGEAPPSSLPSSVKQGTVRL